MTVTITQITSEPPLNLVKTPRQKRPTNFQKGLNDRDIGPDFYVLLFADYSVQTKEERPLIVMMWAELPHVYLA